MVLYPKILAFVPLLGSPEQLQIDVTHVGPTNARWLLTAFNVIAEYLCLGVPLMEGLPSDQEVTVLVILLLEPLCHGILVQVCCRKTVR